MVTAKYFLIVISLLSLSACDGNVSFPPLGQVTRVEVRTRRDEPVLTIDDQDKIKAIVNFVDRRRTGWGSHTDGVPVPEYLANFYDGDTFKGHFGYGRDFFETQRDGRGFFSKDVSAEEVAEFKTLLGVKD
jgi:hypothetical protein